MDNEFLYKLRNPERPAICIGAEYTIIKHGDKESKKIKYRAVKKYKHHVVFEDERGIRESFIWWELARCLA